MRDASLPERHETGALTVSVAIVSAPDRAATAVPTLRRALEEAAACDADLLVLDDPFHHGAAGALWNLLDGAAGRVRVVPARAPATGLERALAEAHGEIVAVLGGDAVPREGWLRALLAPFAAADVGCVGGPVVLRWDESPAPGWLQPPLDTALGAYDLGDRPRRLRVRPGDVFPTATNVAVRVAAVRSLGDRWRPAAPGDADDDLGAACDASSWTIVYVPDAVVERTVPPDRVAPERMLRHHFERGRYAAARDLAHRGLRPALGRLRWHHRANLAVRSYRPALPIDSARLLEECRRREALGYVAGLAAGLLGRVRGR